MADSWHCGPQKVAIEHLLHLPVARRPQTRQRPSLCKEARLALYRQISIDRRRPACASATLAMQLLSLCCREYLLEVSGSALLNEGAIAEPGTQRQERRENLPIPEALFPLQSDPGEKRVLKWEKFTVQSDISLAANQLWASRQLQNDVTGVYRLECHLLQFLGMKGEAEEERKETVPFVPPGCKDVLSLYSGCMYYTFNVLAPRIKGHGWDVLEHASW